MRDDRPLVAVLDDDEFVCRALCRLLSSLSFRPIAFSSGGQLLAGLEKEVPRYALVDLHMPGMNGLEVLRELRNRPANFATIIITGSDSEGSEERCLEGGAAAYLRKPITADVLSATFEALSGR